MQEVSEGRVCGGSQVLSRSEREGCAESEGSGLQE